MLFYDGAKSSLSIFIYLFISPLKVLVIAYPLAAGFNSLFLYRRFYRCHTTLDSFSFDDGNVERKKNPTLEEFSRDYDGRKPVW